MKLPGDASASIRAPRSHVKFVGWKMRISRGPSSEYGRRCRSRSVLRPGKYFRPCGTEWLPGTVSGVGEPLGSPSLLRLYVTHERRVVAPARQWCRVAALSWHAMCRVTHGSGCGRPAIGSCALKTTLRGSTRSRGDKCRRRGGAGRAALAPRPPALRPTDFCWGRLQACGGRCRMRLLSPWPPPWAGPPGAEVPR